MNVVPAAWQQQCLVYGAVISFHETEIHKLTDFRATRFHKVAEITSIEIHNAILPFRIRSKSTDDQLAVEIPSPGKIPSHAAVYVDIVSRCEVVVLRAERCSQPCVYRNVFRFSEALDERTLDV